MNNKEKLKKQIAKLSNTPGVYFFRDSKKRILYIGKATSLRDRVRSYFANDLVNTRGQRIVQMVNETTKIDFKETDSVLEALILEAHLIKKHSPKYNIKEKDNKSYNYVVITKEDYPRVLIERGRVLDLGKNDFEIKDTFGPFTQGKSLREALKIIRKIFPFRDKCKPASENKNSRPCFNYQIKLCPGVCIDAITKKDYRKNIKHISDFFKGKKKKILKDLEKEMKILAKEKKFEKAQIIKEKIFALNHIKDVSLLSSDFLSPQKKSGYRIEGYDISHMSGQNVVGVMTVVIDGEPAKNEYRKFKIKGGTRNDDTSALREVLERRLGHPEWDFPDLIAVDGGKGQLNAMNEVLIRNKIKIDVVSVVKDNKHKAREILGDKDMANKKEKEILLVNAESHRFALRYQQSKRKIV